MGKHFLDINELKEYLGVSKNTIYYWMQLKYIPSYKFGRLVKFDSEEIESWIKAKKRVEKTIS